MNNRFSGITAAAIEVYNEFKKLDKDNTLTGDFESTKEAFRIAFTNNLVRELGCSSIDEDSIGISSDALVSNFVNTLESIEIKRNAISYGDKNIVAVAGKVLHNTISIYDRYISDIVKGISNIKYGDGLEPLFKVEVVDITSNDREMIIPIYQGDAVSPINVNSGEQELFKANVVSSHYFMDDATKNMHLLNYLSVEDVANNLIPSIKLLNIYHGLLTAPNLTLTDFERTVVRNRLTILSNTLHREDIRFSRRRERGRLILAVKAGVVYIDASTLDVLKRNGVAIEALYGYTIDRKDVYLVEEDLKDTEYVNKVINMYNVKQNAHRRNYERELAKRVINNITSNLNKVFYGNHNISLKVKANMFSITTISEIISSNGNISSYVLGVIASKIGTGFEKFNTVIQREFTDKRLDKNISILISASSLLSVIMAREISISKG